MRKRIRRTPGQLLLLTERLHGGPFSGNTVTTDLGDMLLGAKFSEMHDFVGHNLPSKNGRFGVKPMDRFTIDVSGNYTGTRSNWPWDVGIQYVELLSPGTALTVLDNQLGAAQDLLPTLTDVELSSLASEARTQFVDQMPQQLSVPNFAYEFGEVAGLAKGLLTFAERLSVNGIAGSYLAWEFGGAPFIGDLYNLSNLVSTINKRLQQLRDSWGKETRLSFVRKDVVPIPVWRDWTGTIPFIGPMGFFEGYQRFHRTDVRFTARLTQFLQGLDSVSGYLRAIAAATGFNNPLKVVWETVPFSFVVDWVTDVSGLFDSITAQPFQGEWHVYDVVYTVNDFSEYVLRQRDIQGGWIQSSSVGTMRLNRRRRRIGWPEFALNFDPFSMSPQQLILSLALLFGTSRF